MDVGHWMKMSVGRNRTYSSTWWSIEIPSGWSPWEHEECTSFHGSPALGVIQVSAVRKLGGDVSHADLMEFATESKNRCARSQSIFTEKHFGFSCESEKNGEFWAEWWLACGSTLVYLTYNVAAGIEASEIDQIHQIVSSIKIQDSFFACKTAADHTFSG
jgi:hypothetical protein